MAFPGCLLPLGARVWPDLYLALRGGEETLGNLLCLREGESLNFLSSSRLGYPPPCHSEENLGDSGIRHYKPCLCCLGRGSRSRVPFLCPGKAGYSCIREEHQPMGTAGLTGEAGRKSNRCRRGSCVKGGASRSTAGGKVGAEKDQLEGWDMT